LELIQLDNDTRGEKQGGFMPDTRDEQLQEVAILTLAVENVFRKLIRFLVGKISLVKLQEMISYIYVQESERKLRIESPAKRASLSRLAVLTGIDTRALVKITNSDDYQNPMHLGERFLKELTPESSIIESWTSDSRFINRKTGKASELSISGKRNSFEDLIKGVFTARGVTIMSLLDRLEQNEMVRVDRVKNTVSLLETRHAPYKHGEAVRALEIGLASSVILLDTVFFNFEAIKNGIETRYQRLSWTNLLSPGRRKDFEERLKIFLEDMEEKARTEIGKFEDKHTSKDQISAGVGMFYFEDLRQKLIP
jgi:hypothetical protein